MAKLDENGKPARGGKMTVVSSIWAEMSEEAKATFNNTFKTLCEELSAETAKSGVKTENTLQRAQVRDECLHATMIPMRWLAWVSSYDACFCSPTFPPPL